MEILLIALPISALVGYLLGKNKGQGAAGAVGGLLLGPIGWLIVACAKSEGMRKCPYCAEEIKSEATVCRYCGRDLPKLVIAVSVAPKTEKPVTPQDFGPSWPWLIMAAVLITTLVVMAIWLR